TVTSPEFGQGRAIPRQYTCGDRHETPPVSWSGAPLRTRALALVVDDTDAPITPYVYWIVFNINPQITDIQANHLPPSALHPGYPRTSGPPAPGHPRGHGRQPTAPPEPQPPVPVHDLRAQRHAAAEGGRQPHGRRVRHRHPRGGAGQTDGHYHSVTVWPQRV